MTVTVNRGTKALLSITLDSKLNADIRNYCARFDIPLAVWARGAMKRELLRGPRDIDSSVSSGKFDTHISVTVDFGLDAEIRQYCARHGMQLCSWARRAMRHELARCLQAERDDLN